MKFSASHDLEPVRALLGAARFAAQKHRGQQRKDKSTPYLNHVIDVAEILARVGGVSDLAILQAAMLHDTLEDTKTTVEELDEKFGRRVRGLVQEVTDDMSLPQARRRQWQIEHAPQLSRGAQQIRVADKISNVGDLTPSQPDWSLERKQEYMDWAERVVAGCRGCCPPLEEHFAVVLKGRREVLNLDSPG
jgi:guanosine-3',5'-bis(diphosphate) 3'-pyrophosphohydrolase